MLYRRLPRKKSINGRLVEHPAVSYPPIPKNVLRESKRIKTLLGHGEDWKTLDAKIANVINVIDGRKIVLFRLPSFYRLAVSLDENGELDLTQVKLVLHNGKEVKSELEPSSIELGSRPKGTGREATQRDLPG